jgi:glutaconate CoA-transferase, subunit A
VTAARRSKVSTLDAEVARVAAGAHLAFGGFLAHNKPAAFVRALAARGVRGLHLYSCPTASYDADLLIGAGAVAETVLGHVGFDHLGPAPRFTAAATAGTVAVEVADEAIVAGGYTATIEGLPYHPLHSARGHDTAKGSRLLTPYRSHTGHDLVAVAPIAPDVAVLHVQQADAYGNGRHLGARWGDLLIAKAARRVVLTCDAVVDNAEIRRRPHATTIPGFLVDAVVEVPYGAHPCASHGRYLADEDHLRRYLAMAATEEGFAAYVARYGPDQDGYLEAVAEDDGPLDRLAHRLPWEAA